jgi:thiol-disulfide isomerase/thioredoxin
MMKTSKIFLFVLFALPLFSCKNGMNQKLHASQNVVFSKQDSLNMPVEQLYKEFLKKQNRIKLITYNVQRIDTFVDGKVWNNSGKATLERNDQDTVFRFSFYGKRNDMPRESFYREYIHYQVFPETKKYRIETNRGRNSLGSPGGQMVVVDLIKSDTASADISIQNKDEETFTVKTIKKNEGYIITNILTINKTTFILTKVSNTVINLDLKAKTSTTIIISNVLFNDQVINNELSNMNFITDYTQEVVSEDKSADVLIGKKVPETILTTFDNKIINIRSLESKIVLLDFWELWCGSCIKSLPKVQAMTNKYSSKGLITIGIVKDDLDSAKKHLLKEGLIFNQALGNKELISIFKVTSVPRYILIDRKGFIKNIYYGYSEDIEKNIKKLISD